MINKGLRPNIQCRTESYSLALLFCIPLCSLIFGSFAGTVLFGWTDEGGRCYPFVSCPIEKLRVRFRNMHFTNTSNKTDGQMSNMCFPCKVRLTVNNVSDFDCRLWDSGLTPHLTVPMTVIRFQHVFFVLLCTFLYSPVVGHFYYTFLKCEDCF